ncbi:glycosyltransferase family 1 protein [Candidatus Saccharibacteria bacterium]|nr:MAG: glycosyltransferase family 1 protein [Candidatus Saccharibacteria bacterium]
MSRIVIDARRMNSSTGHYVERLVHELEAIDQENEYIVILLEKEKDFYVPSAPNFSVVTTTADLYSLGEQTSLALLLYKLKPDIVHFWIPPGPFFYFGPRVTTIHDTTLIRYENIKGNPIVYRLRKAVFTFLLRNNIHRSKRILVPTEYVRSDLDKWTKGRYSSKFITTLEAGDMIQDEPEPIKALEGKQFLFWVGNAFPYKNVSRIVEAYATLKQLYPDLELGLAGKKDHFYAAIENDVNARGIEDVYFLGYISDGEKRWAFQHACAYVCASLSEGFHIPLLEAQYESCPVITSNATCLPEVAADAALYFDPHSTSELVDAARKLFDTPGLREELIAKGHENTKRFSWRKMGEETHDTYRAVLSVISN